MRLKMRQSRTEQINELLKALALAQREMDDAGKDSKNPFFKSTYADLSSVRKACREPFGKNGLSISQDIFTVDGKYHLETMLGHESGQFKCSLVEIPFNESKGSNSLQAMGSAITYMRRFCWMAIIGLTPSDGQDDDGNTADSFQGGKPSEQKIPVITAIQAKELALTLAEVSPEHREHFNRYLREHKIATIASIPAAWYPNIKKALDSQRLEWRETNVIVDSAGSSGTVQSTSNVKLPQKDIA